MEDGYILLLWTLAMPVVGRPTTLPAVLRVCVCLDYAYCVFGWLGEHVE